MICALILTACGPETETTVGSDRHHFGSDSALAANIASSRAGPIRVWLDPIGDEHQLMFDRRGFPANILSDGHPMFANWADLPDVHSAADGERLIAHWLEKTADISYAYAIRYVISDDQGRSWSAPDWMQTGRNPGEFGFVSYFDWPDRSIGSAWLDSSDSESTGAMALRAARLDESGQFVDEQILDPRVCDCCQTDAANGPAGPMVVYRGRDADELRDTRLVRHVDGQWQAPINIGDDRWQISACPVNGPTIAAAGNHVSIAWYSGADGPQVKMARSTDGGATFGPVIMLDDTRPLGRLDSIITADGRVIVSIVDEQGQDPDQAMIRLLIVENGTTRAIDVAETSPARASGVPRMAADDETLWLVWRDVSSRPARLVSQSFTLDRL